MSPSNFEADIRIELGAAWASSSVNCVPFRHHGILTRRNSRYCTFYDGVGDVLVAHWPSPAASKPDIVIIPCVRKPHDAHNGISLGIDRNHRIHLAYGAHASSMFHMRSRSHSLSDGFVESTEFMGEEARCYTYPVFINIGPERELVLLYRNGRATAGSIQLSRWHEERQTFTQDAGPILDGRSSNPWTAGPYINDPVVSPDGTVSLFFVWRLSPKVVRSESAVLNRGLEGTISSDGLRSVSSFDGPLALPVTPIISVPFMPIPLRASLINQAGAALRADGTPMMTTYWDEGDGIPQYQLIWRDQSGWQKRRISRFKTRFSLEGAGTLPLPHSRPVIAVAPDGVVYCLSRSVEFGGALCLFVGHPPAYDFSRVEPIRLVGSDLGYYEPVIDRGAWEQSGDLVLYVQYCSQDVGDKPTATRSAEAQLLKWSRARLDKAVKPPASRRFFNLRIGHR